MLPGEWDRQSQKVGICGCMNARKIDKESDDLGKRLFYRYQDISSGLFTCL